MKHLSDGFFILAAGVPPSPSNFIVPGNRPLSSMSPVVVLESNENGKGVLLIDGASGGTRIITATALVR